MKMEYNVNIIRGWPYDGALDRAETIKSGTTLVNGDWVVKQSDNTVDKAGTASTVGSAGLVIRGNGDSGSGAYTGKATILWGNFIAQVANLPTGVTFVPGAALTIKRVAGGSTSTVTGYTGGDAYLALATFGTDQIIGYVLDVIAASATNTSSIVIRVS